MKLTREWGGTEPVTPVPDDVNAPSEVVKLLLLSVNHEVIVFPVSPFNSTVML